MYSRRRGRGGTFAESESCRVVGTRDEGKELDSFGGGGSLALAEILAGEGVGIFKMAQREGVAHDEGRVWNMVYYCYTHRYFLSY